MASHTKEVRTWLGYSIAHHLLGAAVQNGRKIDESRPRTDTGDIPAQFASRLIRGEVTLEKVRPLSPVLGRDGGLDFRPRLRRSQTQFPHDGADRGSVGPNAIPFQDRLNPSVPVGALTSPQKYPSPSRPVLSF